MPTHLRIISMERVVYENDVDMVVAPGIEGELGILPGHMPLMTLLQPGELRIKKGSAEESMVVTGGFLQANQTKVTILADAAERAEDIDEARAQEARRRAQERMAQHASDLDLARAEASLRRSLARLRVLEKRRGRGGRPPTV
jgi:F-type H+-transporting ATPase subunit epsilon